MMTAALSSNFTRVPSGRRIGLRWRTTTASSTCRRISGVPLVTETVIVSPTPAFGCRFTVP
mgnify:CR=1 FL=1